MSQKKMILDDLLQGRMITPIEALKKYGCFRLGGRIHELRIDGYDIRKMRCGKQGYAKYYLIADGVRRCF